MTETVSTERLEEIATDKDNFYRDEIKAMAAELLASRTAKPLEAIIRDLVLWINTKSKHLPEKDRTRIQDYMRRMGIQGSVFRAATPPTPIHKEEAKADYFAVQSVSGAHIGLWNDVEVAASVFQNSYPDGQLIPLYASPVPLPVTITDELDTTDLQTLLRLKRDNVWDGSRPVLEGSRSDPEVERAFDLSDRGLVALEQVARGVRLHITRKGVAALTAALSKPGEQG